MIKKLPTIFTFAISILLFPASVALATEGAGKVVTNTIEETIRTASLKAVVVGSIIILGSLVLTIMLKSQGGTLKKILFAGILLPTVVVTIFISGSTIYLNTVSQSKGPVHWHADFEIWDCGKKLDLVDPTGFSNRVGTPTLHEHNDGRIHLEGVVVNKTDSSLGKFFNVVGGNLFKDSMEIPTNSGLVVRHSGDKCPDGSVGKLQVFIYQAKNGVFNQTRSSDSSLYTISPEDTVPPGDCIIVEFGLEKEKTDKICEQYQLQVIKGNLRSAN